MPFSQCDVSGLQSGARLKLPGRAYGSARAIERLLEIFPTSQLWNADLEDIAHVSATGKYTGLTVQTCCTSGTMRNHLISQKKY